MVMTMNYSKLLPVLLAAATLATGAVRAEAADRRGGGHRQAAGQAVPRGSLPPRAPRPVIVSPQFMRVVPHRPYYYPYRPGLSVNLYGGRPYAYPYSAYGYGYSPYSYGPYGYGLPPAGYVAVAPGIPYGGVRIEGAPRDAQVFADGYYVGIVDNFDGVFQHINLEAGPHRIEIRAPGYPPTTFDVRVEPGQTITYHANE